jgi:hypothetical protein
MESNHGYGFASFRSRIDMISDAFGNESNIRRAISEEFQAALKREQERRRTPGCYKTPDWTAATDTDFENAGWSVEHRLSRELEGKYYAAAMWNSGTKLEVWDDAVYLSSGGYRLTVGLISHSQGYDSRVRGNVDKWSPFITDTGLVCISGSHYSGHEQKSVTARSEAAAKESLRKLIERHFKVTFKLKEPA